MKLHLGGNLFAPVCIRVGRLTEKTLRLWAAVEAMSLGRGGITLLAGATGLSRTTIHVGIKELEAENPGGVG